MTSRYKLKLEGKKIIASSSLKIKFQPTRNDKRIVEKKGKKKKRTEQRIAVV